MRRVGPAGVGLHLGQTPIKRLDHVADQIIGALTRVGDNDTPSFASGSDNTQLSLARLSSEPDPKRADRPRWEFGGGVGVGLLGREPRLPLQ